MAEQIKKVAKFSEDAINMGLNSLTEEQWGQFQTCLGILTQNLGEKKESKKKAQPKNKLSEEDIFREHLVAIRERMIEIEKTEMNQALQITVDFAVRTDFTKCNIQQMLSEHAKIVKTEEGLKVLTLFAQFSRGLLYLELQDKLQKCGEFLRTLIEKGKLDVSYTTVIRYMTLTSIILKYPRLILCQMTFTQIMKHKKRLLEYLSHADGDDLNCRLSLPFEMTANGHKIKIGREKIMTPDLRFDISPDWMYHDKQSKVKMTDEELQAMVESRETEDEEAELHSVMNSCHL